MLREKGTDIQWGTGITFGLAESFFVLVEFSQLLLLLVLLFTQTSDPKKQKQKQKKTEGWRVKKE